MLGQLVFAVVIVERVMYLGHYGNDEHYLWRGCREQRDNPRMPPEAPACVVSRPRSVNGEMPVDLRGRTREALAISFLLGDRLQSAHPLAATSVASQPMYPHARTATTDSFLLNRLRHLPYSSGVLWQNAWREARQ